MALKNTNYGRMESGKLVYSPNRLIVNDENNEPRQIFNASTYLYGLQGWLPIVRTEMPDEQEGGYWQASYSQQGAEIVQSWQFVTYPEIVEA